MVCHVVPTVCHGVSRGVRDEPTETEYALRTAADAAIAAAAAESFSAANRIESIDRSNRSIDRLRDDAAVASFGVVKRRERGRPSFDGEKSETPLRDARRVTPRPIVRRRLHV